MALVSFILLSARAGEEARVEGLLAGKLRCALSLMCTLIAPCRRRRLLGQAFRIQRIARKGAHPRSAEQDAYRIGKAS